MTDRPTDEGQERLWGGRFEAEPNELVQAYTSSIGVDAMLFREDIAGSRAHARMLGQRGIIDPPDAQRNPRGPRPGRG